MSKWSLPILLGFCLLLVCSFGLVAAQELPPQLRLLDVDTSSFPTVRVTVLTADATGAPITDLADLVLRENGIAAPEVQYAMAPRGIDATFVLDANLGFDEIDDETGLSRAEKVRDSIIRFTELAMNPEGRDRVSIIVPDETGQDGRFLIQGATEPQQVVEAITSYDAGPLRPTPLNAMITLGLEDLQSLTGDERYRTMLLFTDSRRLPEQLSYPLLTAQANDGDISVNVAILGAEADSQEIDNARRLFEPARGTYYHMPQAEDSDALYGIWQQQGTPAQLIYRSTQRQDGEIQIDVSLGAATDATTFDLSLSPPQVTLQPEELTVRRAGVAANTPLENLQPAVWPLTVSLSWPDGLPRRIEEVRLITDGQSLPIELTLPETPVESLPLTWDITEMEEGSLELRAEVTDELGFTVLSNPVLVEIQLQRPQPPTVAPTAVPPPVATPVAFQLPEITPQVSALALVLLGLTGLLLALLLWRRRKRRRQEQALQVPLEGQDVLDAALAEDEQRRVARLEPLPGTPGEPVALAGENQTIGRMIGVAQIVLPYHSVSPLHARIRKQENDYWLLDEGSAEGTYLNYQRLGLAPDPLHDGDVVQFGTATYTFRLRTEDEIEVIAAQAREPIAVVFDMDGLMVDTEPLSRRAWEQTLIEAGGRPLDEEAYAGVIGRRLQETAEILGAASGLALGPETLAQRKEEAFADILAEGVPAMPGLMTLLDALAQQHIPWGVATSSSRATAEYILQQLELADSCQALAAGDEVAHGKPAPDVYLLAAGRLNVAPQRCLALEDAALGCQAAEAAGMLVVAIPSGSQDQDAFAACAATAFPSLDAVAQQLASLLDQLRER